MKKNNSGVTPLQPGKLLYLAYGSNMSSARMLQRCPRAKWRGKTYIKDWLLRFHYYADIEPCTGGQTPAVIWEISTDEERVLDRYEGFPKHYRKENILVDLDGSPVSTTAYIMTKWKKTEDSRARLAPDEKYLAHIRQGYLENGFTETLPV